LVRAGRLRNGKNLVRNLMVIEESEPGLGNLEYLAAEPPHGGVSR
jgi:hypothetical protein